MAFFRDCPPTGRATCGCLLTPWIPDANRRYFKSIPLVFDRLPDRGIEPKEKKEKKKIDELNHEDKEKQAEKLGSGKASTSSHEKDGASDDEDDVDDQLEADLLKDVKKAAVDGSTSQQHHQPQQPHQQLLATPIQS
jgi:hypothetical protein